MHFSDGLIYTRGSADDYNRIAEVSGDSGWSWDALLPFIKKVHTVVTECHRFIKTFVLYYIEEDEFNKSCILFSKWLYPEN